MPRYRNGGGGSSALRRCEHCDGVIRTFGDYVVILICALMTCAVAGAAWAKHQGWLTF